MSPYFDGCYFDPAYFDAAPCVPASTGGGHPGRWMRRKQVRLIRSIPVDMPDSLAQDDDDLFAGII